MKKKDVRETGDLDLKHSKYIFLHPVTVAQLFLYLNISGDCTSIVYFSASLHH